MAKLREDRTGETVQGFKPTTITAISAGGVFTPTRNQIAFSNDTETVVQFNGTGDTATLLAGSVVVIAENLTYTFTDACNLFIM